MAVQSACDVMNNFGVEYERVLGAEELSIRIIRVLSIFKFMWQQITSLFCKQIWQN